jgi:hypothetical protein
MPKRKQIQDACMLSTFFLAVTSPARIDDCNKTALIAGKAQKTGSSDRPIMLNRPGRDRHAD